MIVMVGGGGDNNSDPSFLGELLKLKTKNESMAGAELKKDRDTDWIEKEADYVDQVILKVGKPEEPLFKESLTPAFLFSLTKPGTIDKFAAIKNPEELVDLVARNFTGVRIQPQVLAKYQKNAGTSELLRNRGNELFKLKSFPDALHYYSLALMFAEPNTEAAGIAFANRSAVLVELGHFQDALQDIGSAFEDKYPERLAHKLEQRRTKCEEFIKKQEGEYLALDPQVRTEIETEKQKLRKLRDELLRIEKPNPVIPSVPDFVQMKFDKDFGRHLAVTKDVSPGTVLMVEDPYAITLFGHSKWDTWYCHQCFKRIHRGIPCEGCVFAIYCDEACRTEASKSSVHRYECKCLPSFHTVATNDRVLQAVRIIFKVGPEELFRLFETRDPSFFNPEQAFGTDREGRYDTQSYLNVFHLPTYSDTGNYVKRVGSVNQALIAASILEAQTNFFGRAPPSMKSEFKDFVVALLLRHIEVEFVSGGALAELQGLENVSFTDSYTGKLSTEELANRMNCHKFKKFAGGLFPLNSLVKHSCDPNVHWLNDLRNGTMIVFSHRALKKGEPLFMSYYTRFTLQGLASRRALLDPLNCHCIACEEDWQILSELRVQEPNYCCSVCSRNFFEYDKKGTSPFRKCVLARPPWKCGSCGKRYKLAELNNRFDVNIEMLLKLRDLLMQNRPQDALSLILKVLDYFQYHLCPPLVHLYDVQDLLTKTLALILLFAP